MVNARPANYPLISSVKEGYPTPNTCGDGDRVEKQGLPRQKEPSAERPAFSIDDVGEVAAPGKVAFCF